MKEYIKKVKGKGKKEQETKIENNLKGLYDYLTAPNIKKKLRNLLFFILRFFNSIKVYLPASEVEGQSVRYSRYLEKRTVGEDPVCDTNATGSGNLRVHYRRSHA
jgi:hypothetical protein